MALKKREKMSFLCNIMFGTANNTIHPVPKARLIGGNFGGRVVNNALEVR